MAAQATLGERRAGFDRDGALGAAALLLLATMLAVVGPAHEPWFDELQAWLIARDATGVAELREALRGEGTPGLWHLLLKGAIAAGLPVGDLWKVSACLALAGAAIVVVAAPFPLWLRVGIACSYFFAYQYAVIARSYALDLVLFPLLACLFPSRLSAPVRYGACLALLANTNALAFLAALCFGLEFAWAALRSRGERVSPATLAGVGLAAAGGIAAVWQAWPGENVQHVVGGGAMGVLVRPMLVFSQAFLQPLPVRSVATFFVMVLATMSAWAVVRITLPPTRGDPAPWLFYACLALILGFSAAVHASPWHAGVLFLAWLTCLWIGWDAVSARPGAVAVVATVVGMQALATALAWVAEWRSSYSSAPAAAAYVSEVLRRNPQAEVATFGIDGHAVNALVGRGVFATDAPGRGWFSWRKDATVQPLFTESHFTARLRRERPDAVLFSMADGRPSRPDCEAETDCVREAFAARAKEEGYCEAGFFPATQVWKGFSSVPRSIVAFEPCLGSDWGALRPAL